MKKRGISAVVATILIILIVVVGVGIVWKVILPLFAELEYLSYSDVQLNIVRQGFTVYDEDQHFAFVQIERGEDDVNMTGVEIGFNFGGTTKTYQSDNFPTPNGKYTYKFNFTNDTDMGIPANVTPDKVTVAPIFTINNKVRLGKILDSEDMPVGRIHMSAEEWAEANEEAATPFVVTHPNGNDGPGESVVDVDPVEPVCTPVGEVCGDTIDQDCDGADLECPSCPVGEILYGNVCAIDVNAMTGGFPRVLSHSGRNYVLTDDLIFSGDAIIVTGENIVFDLQNYEIKGTSVPSSRGINLDYGGGSKVLNGSVFGFDVGLRLGSSSQNIIGDMNLSGNNIVGMYLYDSSDNILEDIIANSNPAGILLHVSSRNNFSRISVNHNYDLGMRLNLDGIYIGTSQGAYGIDMVLSSNNIFTNIVSDYNLDGGAIWMEDCDNNQIIGLSSTTNAPEGEGVYLIYSDNNLLKDFFVSSYDYSGVSLTESNNNVLDNITAINSPGGYGIKLHAVSNNKLNNINSSFNFFAGIHFNSGEDNTFTNIVSNNNDGGGILLYSGTRNNFTHILTKSNGRNGIGLYTGIGNNFKNVNSSLNGLGIYLTSVKDTSLVNVNSSYNLGEGLVLDYSINIATNLSFICNNEGLDLSIVSSSPCSGTGNIFGVVDGSCQNAPMDTWPSPGDYSPCP